jgi:hypothetical protein
MWLRLTEKSGPSTEVSYVPPQPTSQILAPTKGKKKKKKKKRNP